VVLESGRGATERTDQAPGGAEASRIAAPHLFGAQLERCNVHLTGPGYAAWPTRIAEWLLV